MALYFAKVPPSQNSIFPRLHPESFRPGVGDPKSNMTFCFESQLAKQATKELKINLSRVSVTTFFKNNPIMKNLKDGSNEKSHVTN